MATQQDLQELLRLLVGRKMSMMAAMAQIKTLQSAGLRSIQEISEAPLSALETALKDAKTAKSLQTACRGQLSGSGPSARKRPASDTGMSSAAKRDKLSSAAGDSAMPSGPVDPTPQELERSLELPLDLDEEQIRMTVLQTNRAPLVLAFAVELLRYTMPEQPLSSRLSLAQALVSANSRSKAVSLGLEKAPSSAEDDWSTGQPKVVVMGRSIPVLKRSGYEWRGDEELGAGPEGPSSEDLAGPEPMTKSLPAPGSPESASMSRRDTNDASDRVWVASQPVSLKSSTFIARATHLSDPAQRPRLVQALVEAHPEFKTAAHVAWAYRVRPPSTGAAASRVREDSFDDGEKGCGDLMLRVMREVDAADTLVVLTRWFGGILLGPDRWRLMRNCVTGALAERLRKTGAEVRLGGEALWGLDPDGSRGNSTVGGYGSGLRQHETVVTGVLVHRPEVARAYIMKAFATAAADSLIATAQDDRDAREDGGPGGGHDQALAKGKGGVLARKSPKKKTIQAANAEKEENLGRLLGALRLVFDSWADHISASELDRRAWTWYCTVRPEVEAGPSGWGAKGLLKLSDILDLRRQA